MENNNKEGKKIPLSMKRKTLARLAAIQVIYAGEIDNTTQNSQMALDLLSNYENNEIKGLFSLNEGETLVPDEKYLAKIVTNIQDKYIDLDEVIARHLAKNWNINKLSLVIVAILRAAVYEFKYISEVPTKVIINEYTTIAHAFHDSNEAGFVNGILDRIAAEVRQ